MTVVVDIRRPPLTWRELRGRPAHRPEEPDRRFRNRQFGPLNIRAQRFHCAHCDDGKVKDPPPSYQRDYSPGDDCPECRGRGWQGVSWTRRLYFGWAFWRFGGREWYLPSVLTVWHVDPEVGGDDDSCRRDVRRRQLDAHSDDRRLEDRILWWRFRHMHWWHVHHWRLQLRPWQHLRRWLFTRCEECGERFRYGYAPVGLSWDGEGRDPGWRGGERGLFHGGPGDKRDCSHIASLRREYINVGRAQMSDSTREFNAGYHLDWKGWMPWWRAFFLREPWDLARINAGQHPRYAEMAARFPEAARWAPVREFVSA